MYLITCLGIMTTTSRTLHVVRLAIQSFPVRYSIAMDTPNLDNPEYCHLELEMFPSVEPSYFQGRESCMLPGFLLC